MTAAELSLIRGGWRQTAAASKAPEVRSGSYSIPAATVFAFGMLVIEVRPSCFATSSVGGREAHDLNSA